MGATVEIVAHCARETHNAIAAHSIGTGDALAVAIEHAAATNLKPCCALICRYPLVAERLIGRAGKSVASKQHDRGCDGLEKHLLAVSIAEVTDLVDLRPLNTIVARPHITLDFVELRPTAA